MNSGDLVRYLDPEMGTPMQNGLVVQISKTGKYSISALVLFANGNLDWIPETLLRVIDQKK